MGTFNTLRFVYLWGLRPRSVVLMGTQSYTPYMKGLHLDSTRNFPDVAKTFVQMNDAKGIWELPEELWAWLTDELLMF